MTKQNKAKLALLLTGLFLIFLTYFYYPNINKDKILEDKSVQEDSKKKLSNDQISNKYLGEWAGSKLGKTDKEKQNYIQEIIKADMEEAGSEDVFRKVKKDFVEASISMEDSEIRNQMEKALSSAKEDFKKKLSNDQMTTFEKVKYNGLYDLDKSFTVEAEKAYILNEESDVVYMTNMHVILYLSDGRTINIMSNKGKYNKLTYDCFFEQNVRATDGEIKIFAKNLDLLATKNFVDIYNEVYLIYPTASLRADKIDYDFETKYFKVSMFDDNAVKMKVTK